MMKIVAAVTIIMIIPTIMMCKDGKTHGLVFRHVVRPLGEMSLSSCGNTCLGETTLNTNTVKSN